jgi:hypothetical protein
MVKVAALFDDKFFYGVHCPPVKKGLKYDMMNPKPLRTTHVMMIRFSHERDSSTVFPLFEKFISKRATAAVTIAAIVEIKSICL